MLFNSFEFLLLFALTFAVYWSVPHRFRKVVLIVSSILFYASWSLAFTLHFVAAITLNYLFYRLYEKGRRAGFLFTIVALNFLNLGLFKYYYFSLDILGHFLPEQFLTGITPGPGKAVEAIILPLAISFYTFQMVAFQIDVHRRSIDHRVTFTDFFLFIIFFPQLIAGPIMRHTEFLPFIEKQKRITETRLDHAAYLLAVGLFKKVVIADSLARIINPVYADPGAFDAAANILAAYGFAIQIYMDFSGYSDMARGLGRALGFNLPINFKAPYLASSFAETWRRWHITLSSWLRDYLYIPLGGSRAGKYRSLFNSFLTMVLGGLWHGANYTYMVWGGLSGAFLIIERIFGLNQGKATGLRLLTRRLVVFHGWILGAIFFRSESVTNALTMMQSFGNVDGRSIALTGNLALLFILPFVMQVLEYYPQRMRPLIRYKRILLPAGIVILALLITTLTTTSQPFFYFQF